jgi:hypothetical protein
LFYILLTRHEYIINVKIEIEIKWEYRAKIAHTQHSEWNNKKNKKKKLINIRKTATLVLGAILSSFNKTNEMH